jgi:hypothetical protein
MKNPRAADDALASDLRALRASTARDLPSLDDAVGAIQADALSARKRRERTAMDLLRKRPALATLAGATALAIALIFVPFSWERTVGHDVALEIRGSQSSDAELDGIATGLKESLQADGVKVIANDGGCRFEAYSPIASRASVNAILIALANDLARGGLNSSARVEPRIESISGNVYAFAGDQMIELTVERAGRSSIEIEDDLRRQLEDAGFEDAQVSVSLSGDEIRIDISGQAEDADGGDRKEVQLKLERRGGGDEPMQVQMQRFERTPGMTDEQFRAHIVSELEARGVENPQVTVDGDRVQIEAERRIEE